MQVLIHTDHNLTATQAHAGELEVELTGALDRFSDDLTGVDAYLSDQSAGRSTGDDIRCLLEARPMRHGPLTVSHQAPSVAEASGGAARKLVALLTHTFDRAAEQDKRDSIRGH